jgi:hypothetical protein
MSAYTVRFVQRASVVPDSLWTGCFGAALEGRWWYEALELSALDQFEFTYAIVYDGARPVGVAPLFVMDVPLALIVPPVWMPVFRILRHFGRVFRAQRTLFVGSPCSDEGTVGLLAGVERSVALRSLQAALATHARLRNAPMLVWKDFPASYDAELAELSAASGMFRLESFPGTAAELPGPRPEDFYAALRANHRSNIKRKLKRGAAALPLDVAIMTRPDAAALDEIFALFWQTYEKATTRFERLNRRFFERIARCPQSHFVVLRSRGEGKMVAFMLCFLLDGKAINKFIGIDYRRTPEAFLYFRLWDAALTWACSVGAQVLQSGQTGYSAKLLLEHRLQPLTNWCVHRNRLVHAVYRHVAAAVSWATLDPDLALHLAAHPHTALADGATPAAH